MHRRVCFKLENRHVNKSHHNWQLLVCEQLNAENNFIKISIIYDVRIV